MVSIKINSKQYIKWVNTCWYGTTPDETPIFTIEQARSLKDIFHSHYIYHYDIVENGQVIETINNSVLPIPTKTTGVKKSIFKLKK